MTVTYPTTPEDLTIRDAKKLVELSKMEGEREKAMAILKHFLRKESGESLTDEELAKLPAASVEEISNAMAGIMKIAGHYEPQTFVQFNGTTYGFHPDPSNLAFAEFMDLEEHAKDGYENMERMVSVLYRPAKRTGKFYTIEDFTSREWEDVDFGEFPFVPAKAAYDFFLICALELRSSTRRSLRARETTSGRSGVGSRLSTIWRRVMSRNTKRS